MGEMCRKHLRVIMSRIGAPEARKLSAMKMQLATLKSRCSLPIDKLVSTFPAPEL